MSIDWSEEATQDLADLRTFIEQNNLEASRRIGDTILALVEQLLSGNAQLGHPGRVPGTRELVIPKMPYVIPYRVRGSKIEIARVYHTSRRWPERL